MLLILSFVVGPIQTATAQSNDTDPIDVILVIDDSGSMSDRWASGTRRPNDPQGLRHSAARLFIDLAQEGDRVGTISFHSWPTALGELAQGNLTTISGRDSREGLKNAIVQPTEPAPEQRLTDMRLALQMTSQLLQENATGNRQFVVFLSDGLPYPPDQRQELRDAIRELANNDVTMFPILLGKDVDEEIADLMAGRSGGVVQSLSLPGDLLQAYARVYGFIQPERYVDEIDLSNGRLASFRTSPDQGITHLNVLLPKSVDAEDGFADLTLNGESILNQNVLADGASLGRSGDTHYEVVTLANNAPLAGEWIASATSAGQVDATQALVIADSVASLLLQYPIAEDAANSVAPRYYPSGKPVLMAVAVEQDGARVTGLDMQAVADGVLNPLSNGGLSSDGSLYWSILPLSGSERVGESTAVEVQIGNELTPIRLQKEFSLVAADLPSLVADSPTSQDRGLSDDGRLHLKTHFEGEVLPEQSSVVAYVTDVSSAEVTEVNLACGLDGVCEDRSFIPQQGTTYQITYLADAVANDIQYSDHASTDLTMRDALLLDSLPPILDFGRVPPYETSITRDIVLSAFTNQDVELEADLVLQDADGATIPGALGLSISRPENREGSRYISVMQLTGFDALPPGEYNGRLDFRSSSDLDINPPSVAVQFTISIPEIELSLPESPYLGDLARPGDTSEFNVEAEFTNGRPSDIEARLIELSSGDQVVDSSDFQVTVGAARPVSEGSRRFIVPVQLTTGSRPKPGLYQGAILFSSSEGLTVDPQRTQVTFSVPQPVTNMSLPEDRLDFGASADLSNSMVAEVQLDQTILDQPPPLVVSIENLRHSEGLVEGEVPALEVNTGAVRPSEDGTFTLPIFVAAVGKAVPGLYEGSLRIETTDDEMLVQPAKIDFLVRQYTPLQAWQQRLMPVANFLYAWFVPLPLLRLQGLVGWLILLILINTLLRVRPSAGKSQGMISADETGQTIKLNGGNPVYLVSTSKGAQLSQKKRDRSKALAIISMEQSVDSRSERLVWRPVVRPNTAAPEPVKLSYWRQRNRRWYLIKEEGTPLRHGVRFRLRLPMSGERYHFRYNAQ